MERLKVDFSSAVKATAGIVLTLAGFYLLVLLKDLVLMLFLAFIFASGLKPVVERLQKRGLPEWASVLICFIGIFIVLGLLGWFIVTPLFKQLNSLIEELESPEFVENINESLTQETGVPFFDTIFRYLRDSAEDTISSFSLSLEQLNVGVQGVFSSALKILNVIIYSITTLLFTWYILAAHEKIFDFFLFPIKDKKRKQEITNLILEIEHRLGHWLQGQIFLMFIIGLMTYIVLRIMHVPFALPLALLAGLLEIVPNLGPIIAAILTVPIVLVTNGFWPAVIALIAYYMIQNLENYIIVPNVMQAATGINAFAVLIGIIAGNILFGFIGAIIAVPVMVIGQLLIKYYFNNG